MTILVTGVAGFIGSYVAEALLLQGKSVLGIDNLNDYYSVDLKNDRLSRLSDFGRFNFFQIDVADIDALWKAIGRKQITAIVHLAAQAGVRYSVVNPKVYADTNLIGHANMLEVARNLKVDRMLYASSSSIYGNSKIIPYTEDSITDSPVSFYAATKKANELMSHSYATLYQIPLVGLRFFTVYGPRGRPDMAYWLFTEAALERRAISLFNGGDMVRDFTYISDIVDGVTAALNDPINQLKSRTPHQIFNLGNDQPVPLNHLVRAIEKNLGLHLKQEAVAMQPGDVEQTWADITKARVELNYDPKVNLEEGMAKFCKWYTQWANKSTPHFSQD